MGFYKYLPLMEWMGLFGSGGGGGLEFEVPQNTALMKTFLIAYLFDQKNNSMVENITSRIS